MYFPLASLSRLLVTGKDRAKYLHNFCTNNIKELPPGKACEAFFCDVKARIIAHGYVLAFDDCHEIWMLGGDEPGLLNHLNRYIIMEDVVITSMTAATATFGATDTDSIESLLSAAHGAQNLPGNSLDCRKLELNLANSKPIPANILHVTWADTPVLWIAVPVSSGAVSLPDFPDAVTLRFEQLRIRARFPIVSHDMTIENMAPEAERNAAAISYVKGCYLGQEPIARLDAMGHVNRALRCVESEISAAQLMGTSIFTDDGTTIGTVTSAAGNEHGAIGLTMLRTNAIQKPLHVIVDGQNRAVKVVSQ